MDKYKNAFLNAKRVSNQAGGYGWYDLVPESVSPINMNTLYPENIGKADKWIRNQIKLAKLYIKNSHIKISDPILKISLQ